MKRALDIGSAQRPMPGEVECGDSSVVLERGDILTCSLVDGLGHGPEAAKASRAACDYVREYPASSLTEVMSGIDESIRYTRGAAVTLLRIDTASGEMKHAAIGNVEVKCHSKNKIRPITFPGVVGNRLRKIVEKCYQLHPGDIVVTFTDGISGHFDIAEYFDLDAQSMANRILERWARKHDDASCVVVKY